MTRFVVRWRQSGTTPWTGQNTVDTGTMRSGRLRITGLANGTAYDVEVNRENPGANNAAGGVTGATPNADFEAVDGFTNTDGAAASDGAAAQVGTQTAGGQPVPGVLVTVQSNNVNYVMTYNTSDSVDLPLGKKTGANNASREDFSGASPGVASIQGGKSTFFPWPSPTPQWTEINITFSPTRAPITITPQ